MSVKGWPELQRFLNEFSPKVERNILRGAMRAGMNAVKPDAQRRIRSVSGALAAGLKVGTRARGGRITAKLKATGPHAPIAHLVEYGTDAHRILPKIAKVLKLKGSGRFARRVAHPGARLKPFMRPALDAQSRAAVTAVGSYIKQRLATRHGLDTAHIQLEGDE